MKNSRRYIENQCLCDNENTTKASKFMRHNEKHSYHLRLDSSCDKTKNRLRIGNLKAKIKFL